MSASGPADVAVHRGDCVTERWVNPVEHDQTRSVVSGGLLEVTGCWDPASDHDLTDTSGRSWNLTRSDRTLGS